MGWVGRVVSSSVVLVAVPYTYESTVFCPDSSINIEAKGEWAACVPTWCGFPHDGDNGDMGVGGLVLLHSVVAWVGIFAQLNDKRA